jgi:hypothetical protein
MAKPTSEMSNASNLTVSFMHLRPGSVFYTHRLGDPANPTKRKACVVSRITPRYFYTGYGAYHNGRHEYEYGYRRTDGLSIARYRVPDAHLSDGTQDSEGVLYRIRLREHVKKLAGIVDSEKHMPAVRASVLALDLVLNHE